MQRKHSLSTTLALALAILLGLGVVANLGAQQEIRNAALQQIEVSGSLATTLAGLAEQRNEAFWVTWQAELVADARVGCGGSWESRTTYLEGRPDSVQESEDTSATLEDSLAIFVRFEGGKLHRVRAFSSDCEVDAGGLAVVRLSGIGNPESTAYLRGIVEPWTGARPQKGALLAISMHAGDEAQTAMEGFLSANQPVELREKAAFWLANSRGRAGFEAIRDAIRTDENPSFLKKAVFALHVSKVPEAIDELIRLAKQHDSSTVRKQAIFWLSQSAGKKAAETITASVDDDPNREVRKHAVFAISQLPSDEGVPILIRLARSHSDPEVRKKALFWLGQSDDPRSVELFEEILRN
jgi:hypothetical protein